MGSIVEARRPSAITRAVHATDRILPFKKPSVSSQVLENFAIVPAHLETAALHPPAAPHRAQDYNEGLLQTRRRYADYIRSEMVRQTPNSFRFAGCYSYYLTMAQRMMAEPDSANEDHNSWARSQRQRLRVCQQISMFDDSRSDRIHPCDVPTIEIGEKLVTCTVVMLKYVIYTRYQYYLGHKLDSFSFAVKPELIKIWRNAYKKLKEEMNEENENSEVDQQQLEGGTAMSDILCRLGDMLRLRRFTIESNMRSLEKYSRHRFLLWHKTCDSPEVPTYELEDLVRNGQTELLAHTLYSDFVALDSLKKFSYEDVEIVHLQGVIAELIRIFFGVRCSPGQYGHDIHAWSSTTMFNVQQYFLRNGDHRFQQQMRWMMRSAAERAEDRFREAWSALCRDDGRNPRAVQNLLKTYLNTLNVKEAPETLDFKE